MKYCTAIIVMLLVALMFSCSDTQRSTSAARSVDDVIFAWNDVCAGYSFSEYDPGLTMGDAYQGAAYVLDSDGLLWAIAGHPRVDCTLPPDTDLDDILSAVVEAPEWFR